MFFLSGIFVDPFHITFYEEKNLLKVLSSSLSLCFRPDWPLLKCVVYYSYPVYLCGWSSGHPVRKDTWLATWLWGQVPSMWKPRWSSLWGLLRRKGLRQNGQILQDNNWLHSWCQQQGFNFLSWNLLWGSRISRKRWNQYHEVGQKHDFHRLANLVRKL